MHRYFPRKRASPSPSTSTNPIPNPSIPNEIINVNDDELDVTTLPSDPGLRPPIRSYHPSHQDAIRRFYLRQGPCQPQGHDFPRTKHGHHNRRFNPTWFFQYSEWLEYSVSKDAAFCLYCYVCGMNHGIDSAFATTGFSNWKKPERLAEHVGPVNSFHNAARIRCLNLTNQDQHIATAFDRHTDQTRAAYHTHLNATVEATRFLLEQGLAFRGHDESSDSLNPGNFIATLRLLSRNCADIGAVTFDNAPENLKLIAPEIQKDLVYACAFETLKFIISDLGDAPFSILIDEARDISVKEQMAIVIRYVNESGAIIERFLGTEHVSDTSAHTLKAAVDRFLARHGLCISRLRGQGYDGASNMRGEYNGLKALILQDNPCAYYVHCFAHQLQLCLVSLADNHPSMYTLFYVVRRVVDVIGGSCKRRDLLRHIQQTKKTQASLLGDLLTGKGLNQETSLRRAGDTRWGSHYSSLATLLEPFMFESVADILESIAGSNIRMDQKDEAAELLQRMQTFEFVFCLHLMKLLLGITNHLSQALQRKDQDIITAMDFVKSTKQRIQNIRDNEWPDLVSSVSAFCERHEIPVIDLEGQYILRGRSRRNSQSVSNLHHYQVEIFNTVIDMQLAELNTRFTESNTELLICVACLNPADGFASFDKERLIRLGRFYPSDFSIHDCMMLKDELDSYLYEMKDRDDFTILDGIDSLARKMVDIERFHWFIGSSL